MKAGAASLYSFSSYANRNLYSDRQKNNNSFSTMQGFNSSTEENITKEAKRMRNMLKDIRNSALEKEYQEAEYREQVRKAEKKVASGPMPVNADDYKAELMQNRYDAYNKQISEFDKLLGTNDKDKDKEQVQKVTVYNYKEVSTKIQRAKTSVSAAEAVIAAKRKVAEVKRKIANNDGDAEELQLALTHAKRMEMAARKKKHNLELEELVKNTRTRDENLDKLEESAKDMKQELAELSEEEVAKQEDAVFEERQDMLDEFSEMIEEQGMRASDDMMAKMNSMIAEFGEDLLEELEKQMEQLESMEIVDPHMSEEDFEELKRKHRAAESKAMMKADMDYLKGMIKHAQEKGGSMPGLSGSQISSGSSLSVPSGMFFATVTNADVSAPLSEGASPAVDVAL